MSREVCRLITLETKIANGWKDLGRDRMKYLRTDRRRTRARQIMHEAVWVPPGGPDRETALQTVDQALQDDQIVEMLADDVLIGDVVVAICRGCDLLVDADLLPNDARQTTGPLFPPVHRPPAPEEPASEQGPDPP
jgi:phosphoribosylformylglycinamidine (FGAM) synthase-like amidotransferase family enzyme